MDVQSSSQCYPFYVSPSFAQENALFFRYDSQDSLLKQAFDKGILKNNFAPVTTCFTDASKVYSTEPSQDHTEDASTDRMIEPFHLIASSPTIKSSLKKTKSWPTIYHKKSVRFDPTDLRQICMFKFEGTPLDIGSSPRFNMKDHGDEGSIRSLQQGSSIDSPNTSIRPTLLIYALAIQRTNIPEYPIPFFISGKQIQVERVSLQDGTLSGTILVKNLAFQKRVFIRYTTQQWKQYSESETLFQSTRLESDASLDQFSFSFQLGTLFPPGSDLTGRSFEFAVRYEVGGNTYWDNCDGCNYEVIFGYAQKKSRQIDFVI